MTYLEKLRADHPNMSEFELGFNVADKCPEDFGYPEDCDNDCKHCWYKDFPEVITSEKPNVLVEIARQAVNVREAFDDAMGIDPSKPHILDSGDRTQFDSGAVRDMREGKGRCDLTPLMVSARVFCDPILSPRDYDQNLNDIARFQSDGNTCYLYYVLRRFAIKHFGGYETMLLEVAKHFEEGAKKYGESNWQKGIPTKCYIDSAVRHYLKWKRGDNDEPHDRALCWNLMCCIWEVDYGEEWRKTKEATNNV